MPNPMDEIREDIRQLHLKHARGDLREKAFQRALAQRTMDLYKALATSRLTDGERILHEHHVVQSHMKLAQSVLKEPEQVATSLFLTQRRILRVRSWIKPGQPTTADHRDGTVLDELFLSEIHGMVTRRQRRPGEVGVGLAMAALALILWDWLDLTGTLLLVLGALGALHGLIFPTRWIELMAKGQAAEPFCVLAPGKKSGRELLKLLGERLGKSNPRPVLARA